MKYGLICTIHLTSTACSLTGPATNINTCGRIHFTAFLWFVHSEAVNKRYNELRIMLAFAMISLTSIKQTHSANV